MTMSVRRKRFLAKSVSPFFRLMDSLWPKDQSSIVFYSGLRGEYSDNSRYLFERFIQEYGDEFSILWATWSESALHDTGIDERWRRHMVNIKSIRGVLSLLRAKVVLFSWAAPGFPGMWLSKRTVTIQLWHGIPIKRIGRCTLHRDKNGRSEDARVFQKYDYWICSSLIERNSISLCTGIPIDNVRTTGYPRNDYLVEHKDSGDPALLAQFPYLGKRVILYAPTWHSNQRVKFFPFDDFSKDGLISWLERNDAYMILRTHLANDDVPTASEPTDENSLKSERIFILNQTSLKDIQEMLPHIDILISDYSGIWVDFLLLDRPIVFVPYDLAEYERVPGLLYDYDYITPGPKVHRFAEMLSEIESYFANPSKDSERRDHIKRLFHKYDDGLAYRRIYQLIKEAISGGRGANES